MSPRTPPSANVAFDLLANSKRRAVLVALRNHGPLDERVLARNVAVSQQRVAATVGTGRGEPTADDPATGEVDPERVDAVHVSLWHVHLPKLDETALVDHDREERRVAPGPALDAAEPLLEYAAAHPPADEEDGRGGTIGY